MPPRLEFRRVEGDTATDVSYMREDGQHCAVRVFDTSDPATIAGQLRVLAEKLAGPHWTEGLNTKMMREAGEQS